MKRETRKRYSSAKVKLEKAMAEIISGTNGIVGLDNLIKAQIEVGKLIFDMVLNEEGSDNDLKQLVSHGVLLQTILASLDHRNAVMSRINQEKSRQVMRDRIKILYDWLDQNIHNYHKRLDDCAEDAVEKIPDLGMTSGTVKKHITKYRNQNKTICKPSMSSKNIRKKRK